MDKPQTFVLADRNKDATFWVAFLASIGFVAALAGFHLANSTLAVPKTITDQPLLNFMVGWLVLSVTYVFWERARLLSTKCEATPASLSLWRGNREVWSINWDDVVKVQLCLHRYTKTYEVGRIHFRLRTEKYLSIPVASLWFGTMPRISDLLEKVANQGLTIEKCSCNLSDH